MDGTSSLESQTDCYCLLSSLCCLIVRNWGVSWWMRFLSIFCVFYPSWALHDALNYQCSGPETGLECAAAFNLAFMLYSQVWPYTIHHKRMILVLFSMDFSSHIKKKKPVALYQVRNLEWNVLFKPTSADTFLCYRTGPSLALTLHYFVISSF